MMRHIFWFTLLLSSSITGFSQSGKNSFKTQSLGLSLVNLEPSYISFNVGTRLKNYSFDLYSTVGFNIGQYDFDDDRNVGVLAALGPSVALNNHIHVFSAFGTMIRSRPNSDLLSTTTNQNVRFYSEFGTAIFLTKQLGIQGGVAIRGLENMDSGFFFGIRFKY